MILLTLIEQKSSFSGLLHILSSSFYYIYLRECWIQRSRRGKKLPGRKAQYVLFAGFGVD
jgi:hypothetical protein